jgi:hypothetical protein
MKTFLSLFFFIWPEWGVPKGSAGEYNSAHMHGICWIEWYSVVRTHAFIPTVCL